MSTTRSGHRVLVTVFTGIGVILGVVVAILTRDVIIGVIAGSALIAVAVQTIRLWDNQSTPHPPSAGAHR